MIGQYRHFIDENCAPPQVSTIGVYDDAGIKRASMAVPSFMRYPDSDKLYSFGLLSDIHLVKWESTDSSANQTSLKFDNALSFFEEQGAAFCCHTGDMTNIGFYMEGDAVNLYPYQFAEYKRICDLHPNLPVYGVCGNHESYVNPVTDTLDELVYYTGHGLYYTVEHEGDLFIFIGQPKGSTAMNEEELSWLETLLSDNSDKRCFVFIHPYISDDSGNTQNAHEIVLLTKDSSVTRRLMSALAGHGRAVLFHGHSHFDPIMQEVDPSTNYTHHNGFHSVHVSSVASSARLVDGERIERTKESIGYLVDVFADCIVLRGRNFGVVQNGVLTGAAWSPIATFRIDVGKGESRN